MVTQSDGFQVVVLKAGKDGTLGGSESKSTNLIVNRGMPDIETPSARQVIEIVVPRDAFAHGKPDATVSLTAIQADGRPLPDWLVFDPLKGHFRGVPPEGLRGEITIRLIARDNTGAQVETVFRIRIVEGGNDKLSIKGKPSLTRQLADAGRVMRLGERDALMTRMRQGKEHSDSGNLQMASYVAPSRGQKV